MAFGAAPVDIVNAFLGMVLNDFTLIVTSIAGIHRSVGRVAGGARAACTPVIHREAVTIDMYIAPIVSVMAGGALPAKMVRRARMTGLAVILPIMVEIGV